MQKQVIAILALSITLLYACHKKGMARSNSTKSTTNSTQSNVAPPIKNVIVDPKADMKNTGAAYTIDSIKIKDDILSLFVNYSGGCKQHQFELYSNGIYAKSLPPQVFVYLKHTNNDDACRMVITEEQKFNVSKLKHPGENILVIRCGNMQPVYYTTK